MSDIRDVVALGGTGFIEYQRPMINYAGQVAEIDQHFPFPVRPYFAELYTPEKFQALTQDEVEDAFEAHLDNWWNRANGVQDESQFDTAQTEDATNYKALMGINAGLVEPKVLAAAQAAEVTDQQKRQAEDDAEEERAKGASHSAQKAREAEEERVAGDVLREFAGREGIDPSTGIDSGPAIDPRVIRLSNETSIGGQSRYTLSQEHVQAIIDSLQDPTYKKGLIGHNIGSVQPYKRWVPDPAGGASKLVQQQVNDSKGRRGRSVLHKEQKEQLKTDLERVLRATLKENYQKVGIVTTTGVLEKSIEQGVVTEGKADFDFTYTIADLPGERRDWEKFKEDSSPKPRPTTHYYGAIVFGGRPGILAKNPSNPMVFKGSVGLVSAEAVSAASPKNIFDLNDLQIARIDAVMRQSVLGSIETYIKSYGE